MKTECTTTVRLLLLTTKAVYTKAVVGMTELLLVPGTRRFLNENQSSASIDLDAMTRVGTPVPYDGH